MKHDFEKLFLAAPSPFVLLDRDLKMVWANDAYLHATGRSREGIIGRAMFDEFPSQPESGPGRMLRASFKRVFEDGVTDHLPLIPYPIPGPDGAPMERYWSATHTPISGAGGEVEFILQNTQDVTELYEPARRTALPAPDLADLLRRADHVTRQIHELDSTAEFFRMIFDQAPSFMAILTGPEHEFRIVNDAYMQLVGQRDLMGRTVRDALPEVEGQGFFELLDKVFRTGEPITLKGAEIDLQRTDRGPSERAYLDFVYQPLTGRDGSTIGIFVQGHDVTAQAVAEANLREAEERFRTMAQTMPVHVWTARPDGGLDWLSDQVYGYTGGTEAELSGTGWVSVVHPEDRDRVGAVWERAVKERTTYETEFRVRRADGAYRWHLVRATPILDDRGGIIRWIGTNSDIDEQKAMSEQLADLNATLEDRVEQRNRELEEMHAKLRQSQRMEAIGNLAGGVAHDFNNILQALSGSLAMASRELPDEAPGRARIEAAMGAVKRGASLSSQLLAFSRRQALQPRPLDLRDLLQDMDQILRSAIGEAVALEVEAPDDLWPAFVDASSTENAVLNLAMNARDALAGRGCLRIELSNRHLTDQDVAGDTEMRAGDYVELKVIDDGPGIPAETLNHVFEPFFTTKPVGKGTGLGLSMVYGFVRQSGGRVTIESMPGAGTVVTLSLPRAERALEPLRSRYAGTVPGGHESLLLVEDDPDVRDSTAAILEELGYSVRTAPDPGAALEIMKAWDALDMVISDVVMPGDIGVGAMVDALRARQKDLPVLFISGYSRDAIARDGRVDAGVRLLIKPFSQEELAVKVREALDARGNAFVGDGPTEDPVPPASLETCRVLVCEDEVLIRMDIVAVLEDLGADVSQAATGGQALKALEDGEFDVLMVDVGLPDMTGVEVAHAARAARPELAIVFCTGRSEVASADEFERCAVLQKPFCDKELTAIVRRLWISGTEPGGGGVH
ncbi:PAS sensor Signal Tranduction Histidine Kinase [Pseudooceanicola batsensis HTCC2597]|uniref:histidine kinase n=1 Tax=Pseudooceanicola batsensis (strain ATCC BAA-863 / DSM 15984 / KCTC 12145 / HTCC2597) TaxID=252305 RepID=A3TT50_PSEBH|nr:response regulator [Pseudooceanicola batsensis]EAQ04827.1 PAS sensor Signal Tranduction Histidine Kinase [Pseudooceanicola batsensis HTCC2597]